jgi:hypothetical protein
MSAGWLLLGIAIGIPLGGLATYGAIFAWAVRCAKAEGENNDAE